MRARGLRRHRRPGAQEAHARRSTTSANRGLLPPGFALLGFARRDWGDGDFARAGHEARQARARARRCARRSGPRLADGIRFVPGSFDDDDAFDALAQTLRRLEGTHGIQGNAAFYLSIPPPAVPDGAQADAAHRHGRQRAVRRLAPGRRGEAVRPRPAERASSSTRWSTSLHARATSSGSTTTSARRRSRTCWRCASPTRCSSRSGTTTTSTPCRSRWPRTSASAAAPASTTAPAPPATCCRTTCSSCSRSPRWKSRSTSTPRRCAPRSARCSRRVSLPDDLDALRRPRPVRRRLARRRAGPRLPRRGRHPGRRRRPRPTPRSGSSVDTRRWAGVPFYLRTGKRLPPPGHRDRGACSQQGAAPAVRRDRHRGARTEPAGHPRPARRGRHAALRLEGARHRDGGPRRRRWTSPTASRSPSPRPRPTSG